LVTESTFGLAKIDHIKRRLLFQHLRTLRFCFSCFFRILFFVNLVFWHFVNCSFPLRLMSREKVTPIYFQSNKKFRLCLHFPFIPFFSVSSNWIFFLSLFLFLFLYPLSLQLYMSARYIKVKVEHYLVFMFSPPKITWAVWGIKYIFYLLPVFYLIKASSKQIIWFDFQKQNSVLPIIFYVPCISGFPDNLKCPNLKRAHFLIFAEGCHRWGPLV
jgi:hypothetical protein